MKRKYMKPYIQVEPYQLDAAVAASCTGEGYLPLNHSVGSCWDNTLNKYFFNANVCDVDLTPAGDDGGDTMCYHGPSAAYGVTYLNS